MRLLPLLLALLAPAAFAQAPIEGLPPGITVSPVDAPSTEAVMVDTDTPSVRFPDAATPGPTFMAGARLVVLYRTNGQVRVHEGDRYGWLPEAAVHAYADPVMPF